MTRIVKALGRAALACLVVGFLAGSQGEVVVPAATTVPAQAPEVAAPPLRIMPLGASSTFGTGSKQTAGYRGPLLGLLDKAGLAVDLVGSKKDGPGSVADLDHEGWPGWTIDMMVPKARGWISAAKPDIVLLHMGTNDIRVGTSAAEATKRMKALLDEIYAGAPDTHVIVAGIWAPMKDKVKARDEFAAKSAALAGELSAAGRSIEFVDVAGLLAPGDFTDPLHANEGGYRKIAAMWEERIAAYLDGAASSTVSSSSRSRSSREEAARTAAATSSDGGSTTSR